MIEVNEKDLKLEERSYDFEELHNVLGKSHFPSDVRVVVIPADTTMSNFMKVTDAADVEVLGNEVGLTGGMVRTERRLSEFMVKKAMPGTYRIKLKGGRGSYLVQIWTKWGKKGQKRKVYVVHGGNKRGWIDGGAIDFELDH